MDKCRQEKTLDRCNCTYEPCSRKGICCECLAYHWSRQELPACVFPPTAERSYDRSLRKFISIYKDKY